MSTLTDEEFELQKQKVCQTNKEGRVMGVRQNLDLILKTNPSLQGVFRYDERSQDIVISDKIPFELPYKGEEDIEVIASEFSHWLTEHYPNVYFTSMTIVKALIVAAKKNKFDPVRDYLTSLEWDKTPRIETWLTEYFGVKDMPIIREIGRRWIISAVARTMDPGCMVEGMLVFYAPQGAGKNRGLLALSDWAKVWEPLEKGKFKTDDLISLHTLWIPIWDELSGMNKKEINTLKNFLTRDTDIYRTPYGTASRPRPRKFVFCGSTNTKEILRDFTGDRRYYPVEIPKGYVINAGKIMNDRDQLWAEAVELYNRGELFYFSNEDNSYKRFSFYEYLENFKVSETWQECVDETITPEFFEELDMNSINPELKMSCKFSKIQKALSLQFEKEGIKRVPKDGIIRSYLKSAKFNSWLEYKQVKLRNGTSPRLWVYVPKKEEQEVKEEYKLTPAEALEAAKEKQRLKTGEQG